MNTRSSRFFAALVAAAGSLSRALQGSAPAGAETQEFAVPLPAGVRAVWDLSKAWGEATATRERISVNGLWRWQPADPKGKEVPEGCWGYFKVPGAWPGITDYMQKDSQTVLAHPSWSGEKLAGVAAAWYEREIEIPAEWKGRRIALRADWVNSFASVYVDRKLVGEIRFPGGEVDLSSACVLGSRHALSIHVAAMPLKAVMLSYTDTGAAREVRGSVARRGLCGDVWLASAPRAARLGGARVETSVRKWEIAIDAALEDLSPEARYALRALIEDGGQAVREFRSRVFSGAEAKGGRFAFSDRWKPEKLWDVHAPGNMYELRLALLDERGRVLDEAYPERFGFREFWIKGRDFYLNGTRIFLSAVPLDNAQVSAAHASYLGARESLERLRSFGIDFVYTHNYDCRPGSHLGFEEILRAADDVGMLVALSQPHFSDYDWEAPDADETNGYAKHAEFYVRAAGNHPSVVMYSMSHNATGYNEDMNPDLIDGISDRRDEWASRNARKALRAEAIVRRLDPGRIVYHHASGNLSPMHTSNFYPNFVPIQELSDWFRHWAARGQKPFFACEYGAPFTWDWAMYRGWYRGHREFGSAAVPWDFCLAEWNAQFLGDAAFRISEAEKRNLRWEAARFRAGELWYRWDYPHPLGSSDFDERYPILAEYLTENWRAFRTWGVSGISPWEHDVFWKLRAGVARNRRVELETDWDALQRPGYSPDYLEERYERMDLAYEREDWIATPAAEAMYRNNMPLLAYIGGGESFTSKDHNFLPGEVLEKQIIAINDSRVPVLCEFSLRLELPSPESFEGVLPTETGEITRLSVGVPLPGDLEPGTYRLRLAAKFRPRAAGAAPEFGPKEQEDELEIHVLPPPPPPEVSARAALFDPKGETAALLGALGVRFDRVGADADLPAYHVLIVGKAALTPEGPAPDLSRVREGLRALVFEQTAEALERRLGFRVAEYGLRRVFPRVPDHPALRGIGSEHLRDWRGEATLLPPRLDYTPSDKYYGAPAVRWCGLEVPRLWRCGNRGNVASVLIEKPARGDFLPIADGGFSLQYAPLLEYREGRGLVLFCQLDVTGRTVEDPAARRIVSNLLSYVSSPPRPVPEREAVFAGDRFDLRHLEHAGIRTRPYQGGPLSPKEVLVVGRGGGKAIGAHAAEVARWLQAGGSLLALEIEGEEANAFLPSRIRTERREHIACFFEPPALGSFFAGVSPADVHNRAPRELPLVSGGAKILGDGVLAQAEGANAVFCQLSPTSVSKALGRLPSFAVDAEEAADGARSALVTMGTLPWAHLGQKVSAGEVGETYTFSARAKAVGEPVRLRLEVERAARPWDRAVRGEDVEVGPDGWTELRVTFKVERPYPEGWSAYVYCGQEGARFRADLFRLEAAGGSRGGPGSGGAARAGGNLFANASFESGADPWSLEWRTQQLNLRKTYRRASFLLTRLLGNMGVRAETPLLERFSTPVSGRGGESILRNGDFLRDEDSDGVPDGWVFTASKGASRALEDASPGGPRCFRMELPESREGPEAMLSQHDVPVQEGQWYRISLRARSEGLGGSGVALALMDTITWQSFFEYQRFAPSGEWKEFVFLVRAGKTAASKNRFQIWYSRAGTLCVSDVRMVPCDPPSRGRWLSGFYVDEPEEWDDPYRFFRW